MKMLKFPIKRKRRGYTLLIVMILMMLLLAVVYYYSEGQFTELIIARNNKGADVAFSLAEGGVQEAIYRIQYDPATRTNFLTTNNGVTNFSHSNGLINNGSYTVAIQNTAQAAATITATGSYQMGTRTSQRKITLNVIQATQPPPYNYDASLLVGGPNPGDINLNNATINYDNGYDPSSLIGGGNITANNVSINMTKDIISDKTINVNNVTVTAGGNILASQSIKTNNAVMNYGGQMTPNYPNQTYSLPAVDITSDCSVDLNSYKCLAQTQGHYYTSAQFAQLIKPKNTTLTGIYYVAGSGGVTLNNQNLTITGALVSEGTVSANNASLTIKNNNGPSGLFTLQNFSVNNANIYIEGLVYIGVQSSMSNNAIIKIVGAILAHQFTGNNVTITLDFKKDWVNQALQPGSTQSPVIRFDHWEEDY